MYNHGFYVCELQDLRAIGSKSNKFLSNYTSQQNQTETKSQGGEQIEIVEINMNNRVAMMSVENGTAINFRVFNVCGYFQADLFAKIKQVEQSDIPLRNVGLLHVTLWHTSFCQYGLAYSLDTQSVTYGSGVRGDDVPTALTVCMTVGPQYLRNSAKVLFLDGRHLLEVRQQLHVMGDVSKFQQQILVLRIVRKDRAAILRG